MPDYIIDGAILTDIADEIRVQTGEADPIVPEEMGGNIHASNEEIALQAELLEQAITELEGKVDPELYDKGRQAGIEALAQGQITEFVSDIETIKPWAFSSCPSLKNVQIPNVKSIPERAFSNCNALRSITLPGAETIRLYAFYLDYNLNTVDLPKVTKIEQMAFGYGQTQTLILRNEETVCTLDHVNAFTGNYIDSHKGYVYVPDGLVEEYKAATNWSRFADQIKPISELEG